ncbi:AAA family ATPase [Nonomuraea polychroma]|uniref:AAA family ATPase n=1 Tax=Nonomuraea polychroma TaxID=46176 RepID=UPI000FDE8D5A|nr:ATP-binding protein [Nonomuraea polychroma]
MIGRNAEIAFLQRMIAEAGSGRGGTVVVRGEAGIGKSALLEEAARTAGDDLLVLRITGVEAEAELPFATLHIWPSDLGDGRRAFRLGRGQVRPQQHHDDRDRRGCARGAHDGPGQAAGEHATTSSPAGRNAPSVSERSSRRTFAGWTACALTRSGAGTCETPAMTSVTSPVPKVCVTRRRTSVT